MSLQQPKFGQTQPQPQPQPFGYQSYQQLPTYGQQPNIPQHFGHQSYSQPHYGQQTYGQQLYQSQPFSQFGQHSQGHQPFNQYGQPLNNNFQGIPFNNTSNLAAWGNNFEGNDWVQHQ